MLLKAKFNPPGRSWPWRTKIFLAMRLVIIIQLAMCLQISAKSYSQKISVSQQGVSLKTVLRKIEQQSNYRFFYKDRIVKLAGTVSIDMKNASLREVLDFCLPPKGLSYDIVDDMVVIREKKNEPPPVASAVAPQDTALKGTVKDETGMVLPGASVRLKGTSQGTSTDAKGGFTLRVPAQGATLEVSFVGYETLQVNVAPGEASISIVLKTRELKGDEVVVVGYGTQKKSQLIGSVSQIGGKDINNRPVAQLSQALTGQMPGLTVIQRNGRPGQGANLNIRGVGSFGATPNALILIDGIPTGSFNDVDPNDVESISVLKDASSAAIYGARAANGVILVTTKTGSPSQKMRISYNGYVGMQRITATPSFVNSWEYAEMMNEAQPGAYSAADIEKFRNGTDPDNFANADYISASFRKSFMQTGHNISLSNGNENTQYVLSLGYLNQDGVVKGNQFNRYNVRLNLGTSLRKNLKLTARLSAIQSGAVEPATPATLDATGMMDIITNVVRYTPIYPIKMTNGDWGVGVVNKGNPVAWLESESFFRSRALDLNGNLRLDWYVIPDLKLSLLGGYTQTQGQEKTFLATQRVNENIFLGPSSLSQFNSYSNYKTMQALAEYRKQVKRHEFGLLAGYSFEEFYQEDLRGARTNLPSNDLTELTLGDPSTQTNNGTAAEYALQSVFGRLQYNFGRKYLAEATLRYDGSSRFPQNDKYALFPSMAVGWRISEEPFLKGRFNWLDELKLKASYGRLGNQDIGNYPYQNLLFTGYNYPFGGLVSAGTARTIITDPTIHWETTRTQDAGLEASFLKNMFSVSVSYFDRYTYDILVSPSASVSWVLGADVGQQNSGKLSNKGWEFTLNHRHQVGAVKYTVGANLSIINNKVLDLGVGNIKQPNGQVGNGSTLFIGFPMNLYYGYVADGLFTDAADVAAWKTGNDMTAISPNPQPGDIRYKDISGPDGKPDGKVTAAYDRTYLGSTIPKYTYGVNLGASWKGIDFSVLLQGIGGVKGFLNNYNGWALYQNGNVQRWQMEERWTKENPNRNAGYPRMEVISNQGTPNTLMSSYWMLNSAYLRLKNVQLGYNLPAGWVQRAGIAGARISLSAENLFTWSNYRKGWDPETNTGGTYFSGMAQGYYPITANYTVGMNINF